jgi:hypothetical protein
LLSVESSGGCGRADEQSSGKNAWKSRQGGPPENSEVYHCCQQVLDAAQISGDRLQGKQ